MTPSDRAQLLRQLSADERLVLICRYGDRLSVEETAAVIEAKVEEVERIERYLRWMVWERWMRARELDASRTRSTTP